MDMKSTIDSLGIGMTLTQVDRPAIPMSGYFAKVLKHWKVTFTHGGDSMMVRVSQIGTPTPDDLLECLFDDYLAVEDMEFDEWCEHARRDPMDREAWETYTRIVEQREEMIKFLGDEAFDAMCNAICAP